MASKQTQNVPDEPPPSYSQAIGSASSSSSTRPETSSNAHSRNDRLTVPGSSTSGIPAAVRRSMEDQGRPLPPGWVRCYDDTQQHQFFVNTSKNPPVSIWVHPYDDEEYLSSLSSEERERIQQENMQRDAAQSKNNAIHYDSDSETEHGRQGGASSNSASTDAQLPPRSKKEKPSLGRKLKDKLTGMTHEEREAERKQRAEEERKAYEQHLRFRQAMSRAAETGQPQLLGRDPNGKEVYIEPPSYRSGYPGSQGGYGPNAYGYNPYAQGMYASPNSAYMRPGYPYGRPYGRGYGGGYGLPLALGGGLLGGLLLTDLMF